MKKMLYVAFFLGALPTAIFALNPDLKLGDQAQQIIPQQAENVLYITPSQKLSKESFAFKVTLAKTPQQRTQGLQHVSSIADDAGMLFDFRDQSEVSMWMKNTPLTLDMIFIGKEGNIIHIAHETQPFSTQYIGPIKGAAAVLEVNGGLSRKLKIDVGDLVDHPWFNQVQPKHDHRETSSKASTRPNL